MASGLGNTPSDVLTACKALLADTNEFTPPTPLEGAYRYSSQDDWDAFRVEVENQDFPLAIVMKAIEDDTGVRRFKRVVHGRNTHEFYVNIIFALAKNSTQRDKIAELHDLEDGWALALNDMLMKNQKLNGTAHGIGEENPPGDFFEYWGGPVAIHSVMFLGVIATVRVVQRVNVTPGH